MRNVKSKLNNFFLAIVLFSVAKIDSQNISNRYFGQNAWMPDTIGNAFSCIDPPCVLYGKLHKKWGDIKDSKAVIIRFGGIAGDKNKPTNYQYIKMIDSIRAKGMEPVMQVPFFMYRFTAQQAAAIVQYVNITKARNVKYWIIGNEPDLSYSYNTSAQVAAYFKPFASAMKAVDPGILTIGPECAWFNQPIINGLTTPNGPDDITGKDPAGRYYLDIISFHTYPFNGTQTRPQVISNLTSPGMLRDNLIYVNGRVNNCNTAHNRTGNFALKTAVTEANINWQNNAGDNLYGVGANSFIGGQFIAEMMGVGMQQGLDFINIWSVVEGNNTALNIGYLDQATGNKKPAYYHFKMLAENFSGVFVSGTNNQVNVKSLGSKSAQNINVMIMNQELSGNYNFTLRLNTGAVSGNNPLKININANTAAEYNDMISNQTTILLTFNLQGVLIKKCVYSLAGHAVFNLPPSCELMPEILPVGLTYFDAAVLDNDQVELKWTTATETSSDFFTVQRTSDGMNYEDVSTVNGAGNSTRIIDYTSVDNDPYTGLSYYRLKQTDLNGQQTYSSLKSVEVNAKGSELIIYPNPSDGTGIQLKTGNIKEMLIDVYDSQGKKINAEIILPENKQQDITINFPVKLSPGIYLLIVSKGDKMHKNKFIIR